MKPKSKNLRFQFKTLSYIHGPRRRDRMKRPHPTRAKIYVRRPEVDSRASSLNLTTASAPDVTSSRETRRELSGGTRMQRGEGKV